LDGIRSEVVSSAEQTYGLIPDGKDIPIMGSNFKNTVEVIEIIVYMNFIDKIYSVVPGYFLSLFTARELEEVVCGQAKIDIELLKQHTIYGSRYNSDSLCIQQFWTVLAEIFDEEQQKLFLNFFGDNVHYQVVMMVLNQNFAPIHMMPQMDW
ncbi:unnamed protein product, partial [Rotaria sp. Silwood1]